jgi:hypothetical protein
VGRRHQGSTGRLCARRRAGDPETVEEFLAKHEPNAAQIDAANFLTDVIDNDRVGKTVFEMKWSRIDLSKSTHQLLTSDRPINMPLGLADPEAYISLPVSPRILFVLPRPESTCNDCASIADDCATLLRGLS